MQQAAHYSESRFLPLIAPTLRQHGILIALVLIYVTLAVTLTHVYAPAIDTDVAFSLFMKFIARLPEMIYLILLWRFIHMRYVVKPDDQIAWMKADIRKAVADPQRIVSGVLCISLTTAIMLSYAQLKKIIPIANPFASDAGFAELDRFMHFGYNPGEALHALIGHPWVITAITGAYNYWMFLLYFMLIVTSFSLGGAWHRIRYLIAFIFCWGIGGNLIATIFSSGGPVYFELLGFGDDFVPLMNLLLDHAAYAPISAIEIQEALWYMYAGPMNLNGISAFPSMHVGSTVLMTLFVYQFSRFWGRVMVAFSVVIMIGSVLLGWHYAADGYASTVLAIISWWAAGALMRLFPKWAPPREPEPATAAV